MQYVEQKLKLCFHFCVTKQRRHVKFSTVLWDSRYNITVLKNKTNLAFGVVQDKKEYNKRIKMKKEYGVNWEWFNKLFYTILCKTMWTLKSCREERGFKILWSFLNRYGARTEKIWYQQVGLVYY